MSNSARADGAKAAGGDWRGSYGGVLLGGVYGRTESDTNVALGNPTYLQPANLPIVENAAQKSLSGKSVTGTALFGHDFQSGNVVYGVEAGLTLMDFSEDKQAGNGYSGLSSSFVAETTLKSKFVLSLRAKFGYSFGNTMVHVAVGPAISRFKYTAKFSDETVNNPNAFFSDSRTAFGASSNIGVNHAFGNGWVVRGDYVFNYFPNAVDDASSFTVIGFTSGFEHQADFMSHKVGIGLVRYF